MTQFERTFWFMKKIWVIVLYSILVILSYNYVDRNLAVYFHQLGLRSNIPALSYLTALGEWMFYVVLFLFFGLYFRFIQKNSLFEARSWYLFGCVVVANLVCFILKISLSRARPELLFMSNQFGFYWFQHGKLYWSFPSGHTMTIISLVVGLGVLFPRCYFYWILSLGILIALTRITLYYHYLSDVLAGFYLSFLVVGLFTQYLKKNNWFSKKDFIVSYESDSSTYFQV
jgi:membrane-associated phospholipid phosphatase